MSRLIESVPDEIKTNNNLNLLVVIVRDLLDRFKSFKNNTVKADICVKFTNDINNSITLLDSLLIDPDTNRHVTYGDYENNLFITSLGNIKRTLTYMKTHINPSLSTKTENKWLAIAKENYSYNLAGDLNRLENSLSMSNSNDQPKLKR